MSTPDFTDAEIATLRRFEASPHLREEYGWNESPIVPTGKIQHAHQFAPSPTAETGTAAQWSQHFLADSLAQTALGRYLMNKDGFILGHEGWQEEDVPRLLEMSQAYHRAADSFLLGFLFRHVSDEVAREAAIIAECGEINEWSWPYLQEAGLDPHLVKTAETRAEAEAAGLARVAAQRARRAAPQGEQGQATGTTPAV